MCHQDVCKGKCASNRDSILCGEISPELEPNCFPKCPPVDCSETVLLLFLSAIDFEFFYFFLDSQAHLEMGLGKLILIFFKTSHILILLMFNVQSQRMATCLSLAAGCILFHENQYWKFRAHRQKCNRFFKKVQSVATANMFCCERHMKLASLETQFEMKSLANDLKSNSQIVQIANCYQLNTKK